MTGKQILALVVGAIIGILALRYVGLLVLIPALSVAACLMMLNSGLETLRGGSELARASAQASP